MDLTVNPKVDISDTTPLTLGGVEFRVAPLVLRQTSKIGPQSANVLAILKRRVQAFTDHADVALALANPETASTVDAEQYLRAMALSEPDAMMLLGIIHIGLTRVYPRLTLDDLLDLPAKSADLLEAANTIMLASGAVEKKAASPGEVQAASR